MSKQRAGGNWVAAMVAAIGLAAVSAQAWTRTTANSDQPYTVSDNDLLQRSVSSINTNGLVLYFEGGTSGTLDFLTDGNVGPGNREGAFSITSNSVTYVLDTISQPAGYIITGLDSYSGWQDGGRVDQNYVVSFRNVASGTFGNAITNAYTSGMKETRVRLTDINLAGVDAIKFNFLSQENGGVGYKELDVFGMTAAPTSTVAGVSGSTAYPVSATDLLQSALGGTNDAINYFVEAGFTNAFSPALTDGSFGSADKVVGTCGIVGGTMTYTLNMTNHPAGYTVSALDTYSGWGDSGRDNQNYWVSFRKVGSSAFSDMMSVAYVGTTKLTHVNITNFDLTRVEAVRFTFVAQENGGVGYKELDVIGAPPAYTNVTRRDSISQIVASNDTSQVMITEGAGAPGAITLGAATTVIGTLTQGATEDIATIDPVGQTLALSSLCLRPDAGGLTIGTLSNSGTLMGTQSPFVICNWSTNDLTLRAAITNRASAGTLLKTGSGTLVLTSTNACPGGTEVTAGTLRLTGSASLGSSPVNVNGGTLQLDGGTVSPATSNSFKLAFANGTVNQTAGTLNYGGYLQAQNEALNLSGGTSTVNMDTLLGWGGTNTSVTIGGSHTANWRVTRFSSGTVNVTLQSGGKLYTDRVYSSVGATGSLLFDGGVLGVSILSPALWPNDWIGVVSGSMTLSVKAGGAIIDTDNGSVTIRRPFLRDGSSTGGLTKTGRNTLTLTITNANSVCTYAGDTAVLAGTLKLGVPPAPLPASTRMTVATDALLDLNGVSQTVGELNGGGRVFNTTPTNVVLTLGGNNTSTNFSGQIEGAVRLVKVGTGALTLSGANAYTNGTQILGGTLYLSPLPVAIRNAGFELPDMATGEHWSYLTSDGVTGGWTMSGSGGLNIGCGIARNGYPTNAAWLAIAPQGIQVGYLQGNASYCFQTVLVQRAGTYQLSFSAANRPSHSPDNVEVFIDGASRASWTNALFANGGVFKSYATNFSLSAGPHELKFQGTSPGGDTTTTIDDIRLVGFGTSAPGTLPANMAVEIAAGATLDLSGSDQPLSGISGSGLVTNGTLAIQGIIAPGGTNTIGTLTLATATTLSGTLLVDVDVNGSSDLLQVQGSLNLSGLNLQIQDLNQIRSSSPYLIATCSPGGLTGRFASTNLGTKRVVGYDYVNGRVMLIYGGTLILVR
jgi:autotransporter-associated beta strand protein